MASIITGAQAQQRKTEARDKAASAAKDYWNKINDANGKIATAMNNLFGENGSFTKSISDYKNNAEGLIKEFVSDMSGAINKYSGENATKAINKLASEGATQQATKAGATKVGAMRSAGTNPMLTSALINSSQGNDYSNMLGQQQQLASSQYSNALNASMNKYGTALQSGLQKEQAVLGAQGNRAAQQLQGTSNLAANQIGAAGQQVANWQNQAQTTHGTQNLLEKLWSDIF